MKDWDGSGWIGVYDWTPDSKNILAKFSTSSGLAEANSTDLILIPVDGAEPVTVKSFPPYSGFWNASISPDGLWLVYDIRSISSSERELYLTSIGGGATELIVTIDSGGPIGWDSTSEYVWYYEVGKGGSASVSRIRVHDGRPSGTPEVVRANLWEFAPAGMARDNLFYEVTTEREFRYISSMNLDTGEITEQPLRISPPGRVPYGGAAFSPDGEKLAYAVGSPHQYWKSSIVVRSIATGLETEIPEAWWWPLRIVWSPDSRSLLVPTNDAISGTAGIFRIDLQSLGTRLIPDSERALPGAMCISADGKTVYYPEPGEDGDPKRIIAHNLSTGERSVIFESWGFGNFVVSPDGQVLAVVVSDSTAKKRDLVIQELTGSRTRRVILTVPYSVSFGRGPLVFTGDGKRLRYVSTTPTPSGAERALNEIPVSGGEPTRLVQHLPSAHVVISPDGRRFSYISGQRKRELWVMESLPGAPDN
jgi:Tol biopolymer transport system component